MDAELLIKIFDRIDAVRVDLREVQTQVIQAKADLNGQAIQLQRLLDEINRITSRIDALVDRNEKTLVMLGQMKQPTIHIDAGVDIARVDKAGDIVNGDKKSE